jgi:hypothetical protein
MGSPPRPHDYFNKGTREVSDSEKKSPDHQSIEITDSEMKTLHVLVSDLVERVLREKLQK